jgi:hypothetical protein
MSPAAYHACHFRHPPPTGRFPSFTIGHRPLRLSLSVVAMASTPQKSALTWLAAHCHLSVLRLDQQFQRESPSPIPLALLVNNGSKMLSRFSGGMPGPSSAKRKTHGRHAQHRQSQMPPLSMAWTALVIRLRHTCSIWRIRRHHGQIGRSLELHNNIVWNNRSLYRTRHQRTRIHRLGLQVGDPHEVHRSVMI